MTDALQGDALPGFLAGGGETAALIAARDWSATPLGPIERWPASLRSTLSLVLNSPESAYLVWGPDLIFLFNDAYRPILGPRLPDALGRAFPALWSDAWEQVRPMFEEARAGRASRHEDMPIAMARFGEPEDTWWSFSYSPVRDEAGEIMGVLCWTRETTKQVVARRLSRSRWARQRALVEQMPGFVAVLRGPDHVFDYVNDAYKAISGPRAFLGRTVREVFPELEGQGYYGLLDQVYTTGERYVARGLPIMLGAEGERRYIDLLYEPIRNEAGDVVGIFVGGYDATEAHRVGSALAASEARYRTLFDTIDEGFCIIEFFDGPHGPLSDYVHVEANPAYAVHAGIQDVVGQKVREMVPDEADGWVELYGGVLRTGEPIRFERELVATGRHLELAAFRIEPSSRRQVAVLFQDVTARRRAEAALRESEEHFRVFAQTVPNQVWAAHADGRIYWVSDQVLAYCGDAPASADGAVGWTRVVHPDDRPETRSAWGFALRTGSDYETELRIRRRDGVYRWFLVRAKPVRGEDGAIARWVGTNTDIDDRRRQAAELKALLESQVQERTRERDRLWETTNDLMGAAGLDGFLKTVNPAWTTLLGWSEADLLSRPFSTIIEPADHAETADVVARLANGETVTGFVDHVLTRDGDVRAIMWTAVPDPGTDVFHIVGRDLTEQRKIEEALRQAQKMEAVGQLTGGIAHDFNNLLAGISGSLELMGTRISQGRLSGLERYIAAAQGAAKRAAALTHRLLAFSRRQTLDPKPTDVNRLVIGMEDLIRRAIGPQTTLEVVTAGGLWTALIDPPQLENALLNLCINARDAMSEGGRITVETANKWLDDRAAAERDLSPGQYLSVCVTDTGTGMSPEVASRAFDPFFTTKPIGEGTGLGLSMIYGFVRQSGGQVRIYSEPGQGTTICLYLPRHYGGEASGDHVAGLAEVGRAEVGETVLVVDDEPTVRMLVTEVLEDLGYVAVEAADGPSGLKVLRSDLRVDLLVTDVGLPGGMNGRQLADAARTTRPDLKVLFITGYAENSVIGNGHLEPGMKVLTKPFEMETLANRIRAMIEEGA